MADEDLEAIRARRMAELQAQYEVSGARPASSGTHCAWVQPLKLTRRKGFVSLPKTG